MYLFPVHTHTSHTQRENTSTAQGLTGSEHIVLQLDSPNYNKCQRYYYSTKMTAEARLTEPPILCHKMSHNLIKHISTKVLNFGPKSHQLIAQLCY